MEMVASIVHQLTRGLTLSPVGILSYMWHKVGLKSRLFYFIHQAERLTVEINDFITALNAHATETEREIFAKIK